MTDPRLPDWAVPPQDGFTAESLDHIPDLPAHTELIDGSLVLVSPQASFHTVTTFVLEYGLRKHAPEELRIRREMSIILDPRQRPEPDIIAIKATADLGPDTTAYQASDVVLAVEVVSPDSETRDRERKPQLYAAAGIPHFWRVEQSHGKATVYVYELDPATKAYALMGIHHDKLQLSLPFEIDIDLTEVEKL
ncbi:Uma2 family endonuclease [Sphaerisporangium fuscum]|uniref:Uma2 family endonuclease n=1 Tax=Sphaerisporangium fuscum TaxID=2835868 RepID=UPI001BDBEF85|nr:Uma2 family endonuclease [Sphaerisporangium fuscum]